MLLRAVYWLVQFGVLLCVWLLFVYRAAWSEISVGVLAAALAATATEAVRAQEHPRFWPHIRWVLEFWHVLGEIVRDCWLLSRRLLRMIAGAEPDTGRFEALPFRSGGSGPRAVARRALAILYTTLPPNSIVIGIDRKRDRMLLHLLEEAPAPAVAAVLEGKR